VSDEVAGLPKGRHLVPTPALSGSGSKGSQPPHSQSVSQAIQATPKAGTNIPQDGVLRQSQPPGSNPGRLAVDL